MFGLSDALQQPTSQAWSDVPAVGGVVADRACKKFLHYRSLGDDVGEWALDEAVLNASESFRAFGIFFQTHRLAHTHTDPERLLRYWRCLWLSGDFVPLAKWATAMPMAEQSGVSTEGTLLYREIPPMPDWIPSGTTPLAALFLCAKVSGPVLQALRTRLYEQTKSKTPTHRSRRLAWSFLGIKAMMPAMWVDKVGASLRDHADLLGQPPGPLPARHERLVRLVAHSITRLCYPTPATTLKTLPRPKLSSSAGWVKTFDVEARRWRTMEGTRSAQYTALGGCCALELTHMFYTPWTGVREIREIPYQFCPHEWDFTPDVSIVALQEPFKIRTITLADGPMTAVGSTLQKSWHSTMRQLKPFQLIGGKDVATTVAETFRFDDTPFVSGDFSAATDRVNLNATRAAYEELTRPLALDPLLSQRLLTGLTKANLLYGKTLDGFKKKVPDALLESVPLPPDTVQANGQLMGNILSFPILCIINLAGYLCAQETHGREHGPNPVSELLTMATKRGYLERSDLDSLPVLINGDDILFKADPTLYQAWRDALPGYGFKLSVGKNYLSPDFFTVNSELYTPGTHVHPLGGYEVNKCERPWWGAFLPDFVRMRNQIKRFNGLDVLSSDMRKVLVCVQADLRASVPPSDWPMVNKLWMRQMKDATVLDPYSGLNWYLPQEQGGMGLDSSGMEIGTVTYAQKKLAVKMCLAPHQVPPGFGAEGTLLSTIQEKTLADLQNSCMVLGEPFKGPLVSKDARTYVLPVMSSLPTLNSRIIVQGGDDVKLEIRYHLHETVNSMVTRSPVLDKWLDFHLDGVRIEETTVKRRVSKWLQWGCRISDKTVDLLYPKLQLMSALRASCRSVLVTAQEMLSAGMLL